MLVLNAFSLNMLHDFPTSVQVTEISVGTARALLSSETGLNSAVGHADTAEVFGAVLGLSVPCRRETVTLKAGDQVVVGQYSGPRLPDGCKTIPPGATVKWLFVTVG